MVVRLLHLMKGMMMKIEPNAALIWLVAALAAFASGFNWLGCCLAFFLVADLAISITAALNSVLNEINDEQLVELVTK